MFTITATNNGPNDATGVTVADQLPADLTYVSDNASVGTYTSGVWTIGNLANGASATLTITAKVDTTGEKTNTATRTGSSPSDMNSSNDTANSAVVGKAADIALTKTVDKAEADVGSNVVFTITAANNGPNDATGVTVADQLPSGLTYVSDDSSGSYVSGTGVWTIGNLANGANATLQITATVDTAGAKTNTAERTASSPVDTNSSNDSDSAAVDGQGADIAITKTVDKTDPDVGSNVVFTITATNNGPNDATGVTVADQLLSGLTYVSDTPSTGTYSSGVWNIGNLANGANATLQITATVDTAGVKTNTAARTASSPADLVSSNDTANATTGGFAADIAITKTVDKAEADVGGNVVFIITATNNGPNDATGVTVADQWPSGLTYVRDDSSGSYVSGTGVWTIGNLANGVTATLQITATVDTAGVKTNTATRSASTPVDTVSANDSDSAAVDGQAADIAITKVVDISTPDDGQNIIFTITATNNGPNDASGVSVTDQLPNGLTYISDDSSGSYVSGTGVWTIGALANGASATLQITASVDSPGEKVNTATKTASSPVDPTTTNNSASRSVFGPAADISVEKTADNLTPDKGTNVVFTITVTNEGTHDATGVVITDQLPTGLTYISDTASAGTYTSGVWTIGSLAKDAVATLTVTASVDVLGKFTNTAARTASSPSDPNSANDSASVTVSNDADEDGMPDKWEDAKGVSDPAQDPDGDGLTNLQEFGYGTEPKSADSDNDGMKDKWELDNSLDPTSNADAELDSDSDGFTNKQEHDYGTNPNEETSKPIPPVADAGPDQNVDIGARVKLDSSNSFDPDGNVASRTWTQTSGTTVTLSSATAAKPTFTAPSLAAGQNGNGETLTFELTVTDDKGIQSTDTCIVNVLDANEPPAAQAGSDQNATGSALVTLDGSSSSDLEDGAITLFQWVQILKVGETAETLSDAAVAKPTFTAPDPGTEGKILTFELTVTDSGGLKAADAVIINVPPVSITPPTAVAVGPSTVTEGATVTLDGSGSTDPDNDIVMYQWKQIGGIPVTLSDAIAASAKPTFVAPAISASPGSEMIKFQLIVTDSGGFQGTADVTVEITDNGIVEFAENLITTTTTTSKNIAIEEANDDKSALTSLETTDPDTITDEVNKPDEMPYGLIDIGLKVYTPGDTVDVIIHLSPPAPAGYQWYKYSPTDGWIDFSARSIFNADRSQVTLTLTDGGIGDDDGAANGSIIDPSGLGLIAAPDPDPEPDPSPGPGQPVVTTDGGGGCFISSMLD